MSSENLQNLKKAKAEFHKELWVESGCPPPKYSDFKSSGVPLPMQLLGQWTVNFSKEFCPRGAGKGGGLMGSLRYVFDLMKEGWSIVVGTNQKYAEDVEEGTDPHMVYPEDLYIWVKRKLDEKEDFEGVAWAVSKKIAKKGTKAQPYLLPGAKKALKKWQGKYG